MPSTIPRHLGRFVALTTLCFVSLPSAAATRHVPADYPTIQAAIDAAAMDDEILVDPGTYLENLDTHGKRLALMSTAGPSATIVDGRSLGRVIVMTGGGLLEGFTVQGGYHDSEGGGIYSSGGSQTTTIRNNVIRNNAVGFPDHGLGGGIALPSSNTVLVEDNDIIDNYSGGDGGGLWAQGNRHLVRGNVFKGNFAGVGGGAASVRLTELRGNLVVENGAQFFGGGLLSYDARMENNTIVENRSGNAQNGAGIYLIGGGTARRNIVAFNRGGGGISWPPGENPLLECNDSWGNDNAAYQGATADTVGRRNFSIDPQFCGRAVADFTIDANSSCSPAGPSGCGLIGAFDVGCGVVPARRETWGTVKVRYR